MTDYTDRNIEIIRAYVDGQSVSEIQERFGLSRGRLYQILKDIVKVRKSSERNQFLGVEVTSTTKKALKEEAKRRGVSVSALVSDTLDAQVSK
jgi:hypothetical protein